MDDAEYLFKEDVREKKIIARSARNKKSHSGCHLPSDFMSRKEIEQMNGEVQIINTDLHRPLTWKYFRMLSKEEQTNYIQYLLDTFHCTGKQIADKFKLNSTYLCKYIREQLPDIKLPHGGGYSSDRLMAGAWEKFWAGEEETMPENASESLQNAPEMTSTASPEETYEEKHDRVMGLLESGMINVNQTADMLGIEFKPGTGWDVDKLNSEKLEGAKQRVAELKDELVKAIDYSKKPDDEILTYCKNDASSTQDLHHALRGPDVITFSVDLRDVHDLEDVLKYLRVVNWPKNNTVYMRISERG